VHLYRVPGKAHRSCNAQNQKEAKAKIATRKKFEETGCRFGYF
jgi:hypothetical protein